MLCLAVLGRMGSGWAAVPGKQRVMEAVNVVQSKLVEGGEQTWRTGVRFGLCFEWRV